MNFLSLLTKINMFKETILSLGSLNQYYILICKSIKKKEGVGTHYWTYFHGEANEVGEGKNTEFKYNLEF